MSIAAGVVPNEPVGTASDVVVRAIDVMALALGASGLGVVCLLIVLVWISRSSSKVDLVRLREAASILAPLFRRRPLDPR